MPTHRRHKHPQVPTGKRRARSQPDLPTVHIEVMVDTNAHGWEMDADIKTVRQILEFRDYLQTAAPITGVNYDVRMIDTAQIFHEKCGCLTPKLAREAGVRLPKLMEANLSSDIYRVEPPVHGEAEYYDALAKFFFQIMPDIDPDALRDRGIQSPEDFTPRDLQDLFLKHMRSGNWKERFVGTQHEAAYREFHKVRFNAGEETAINFLRDHPYPKDGDRTAFVFVGADKWANKNMATARQATAQDDRGRFEVFVGGAAQFRQMIEQVIQTVEGKHPELRQMRKARFHSLSMMMEENKQSTHGADFPFRFAGDASGNVMRLMDFQASTPQPPVLSEANDTPNPQESRRFADFVLDSRDQAQPKKQQGR